MRHIHEDIYREVIAQPVPDEGLVLPTDIIRRRIAHDTQPTTQHEKLLLAFYAFVLNSLSTHNDAQTFSNRPARHQLRLDVDHFIDSE